MKTIDDGSDKGLAISAYAERVGITASTIIYHYDVLAVTLKRSPTIAELQDRMNSGFDTIHGKLPIRGILRWIDNKYKGSGYKTPSKQSIYSRKHRFGSMSPIIFYPSLSNLEFYEWAIRDGAIEDPQAKHGPKPASPFVKVKSKPKEEDLISSCNRSKQSLADRDDEYRRALLSSINRRRKQ